MRILRGGCRRVRRESVYNDKIFVERVSMLLCDVQNTGERRANSLRSDSALLSPKVHLAKARNSSTPHNCHSKLIVCQVGCGS